MQGFFQISTFTIPRTPEESETGDSAIVDYALISRRSRDRAGLRYQRRGVDDDANVANFVETEAVTRVEVSLHDCLSLRRDRPPKSVRVFRIFSAIFNYVDQVSRIVSYCTLVFDMHLQFPCSGLKLATV